MLTGLALAIASSVASAQPALPEFVELSALAEAIDGDAQQWTETLADTVDWLAERAAGGESAATRALVCLVAAEDLRAAGPDVSLPDEAQRTALRQALAPVETWLRGGRGVLPPPPMRAPRAPTANPALERLRGGGTPLTILALLDLARDSDDPELLHSLAYLVRDWEYPEAEPFVERVFATHVGGDTEAGLGDAVAGGRLVYRHAEAAGLLYLLQPDNFSNVQGGLLRAHERWTDARLLRVLPAVVAAYEDRWSAPEAARALAQAADLPLPEGDLTLADRAALYRAWRDEAAPRLEPTLPPLIDPAWDPASPVVAALQAAAERLSLAGQRSLVVDTTAPAMSRRGAARRLAFEGTDDCWQTLEALADTDADWQVLAHVLMLTEALSPERVAAFRQRMAARLGTGERGARTLVLATTEAKDEETVRALASLAESVDREAVCRLLEEIALGQRTPPHWQGQGFEPIRNTITAYGAIDLDRARAFYHGLLQSEVPNVRRVGIYGVGELRVIEAVPQLLPLVDPAYENCFLADCVIVALGKISTPEAHDALIEMLDGETDNTRHAWEIMVVLCSVCGREGRSPLGEWWNGCWATVADDLPALGPRIAQALTELADRTTDERLAREARSRAQSCLRAAERQGP
jgi:hypothetical protein